MADVGLPKLETYTRGNTEESVKKSWIEIFAQFLRGGKFKEIDSKADKAIEKSQTLLSKLSVNAENAIEQLVKLSAENKEIDKSIEKIGEELGKIELGTRRTVIEKKVKELIEIRNRILKKLEEIQKLEVQQKAEQKKLPEETEKIQKELKAALTNVDSKEISFYLRELYKPLPKSLSEGSKLQIKRKDLIQQVAKLSNSTTINEESNDTLYAELRLYHKTLAEKRKNIRLSNKEEELTEKETKNAETLAERVKKERERYRNSAEIKSLLEKLNTPVKEGEKVDPKNYLSPTQQARLLHLLERHIDDLEQVTAEKKDTIEVVEKSDEDKALAELAKNKNLQEVKNLVKDLKDENIQGLDKLKNENNIEERQKIIRAQQEALKNAILDVKDNEEPKIKKFFEETKYEEQVKNRIRFETARAEGDNSKQEFIHSLHEMKEMMLREDEMLKRVDAEGEVPNRAEAAKSFARRRIMEEFADVEKVRALFGNKYAKEFEKNGIDAKRYDEETKEFKREIFEEIKSRYNIDESFGADDDAKKTELKNTREFIEKQVDDVIRNYKLSSDLLKKIENDKDEKEKFINQVKIDILDARKKSENISEETEENKQKIAKISEEIDELFKSKDDIDSYEIIATPNGLAIAFTNTDNLKTAIVGNRALESETETIAVTLKSNDKTKTETNRIINGENWNGNLMLVACDRGEHELTHEVQHAILRDIRSEEIKNSTNETNIKINSTVEEFAIRIASGELWDEMSLPEAVQQKERMSLASLAYVTKADLMDESKKDDIAKLHQILEISKKITKAELDKYDSENDPIFYRNINGANIADILLANQKDGKYDLEETIKILNERYKDLIGEDISQNPNLLTKASLFGFSEEEFVNLSEEAKAKIGQMNALNSFLQDNPGFDFRVVQTMDTRGAGNRTIDAFMEPGRKPTNPYYISMNDPMKVGVIAAAEIPIISGLWSATIGQLGAKRDSPGPIEYHVSSTSPLSYKIGNRAYGGILRRIRSIPVVGWPLLLIPERKLRFPASAKIFNYLPPFGRAWELIIKDTFPGVDKWLKDTFPGRPNAYEATRPSADLIWNKEISTIAQNLGPEGLGLSQAEWQRVMGELPGIAYEFDSGRLKFEPSRNNFEKLVADEDNPSELAHRGKMTAKALANLSNERFNVDGYPTGETIALAERMHESYDRYDYAYTMNDLIHAAHQVHDLGINPLTKNVRNTYYADEQDSPFEQVMDPERGLIMQSDKMWYSLDNPNKRGVVVDGELYSLAAAHELIRRYNLSHIYTALHDGLPEVTAVMQKNEYEPDRSKDMLINAYNSENQLTNNSFENISRFMQYLYLLDNPPGGTATKNNFNEWSKIYNISLDSTNNTYRFNGLNPNFVWDLNTKNNQHYPRPILMVGGNPVRNRFANDSPYSTEIPGIGQDPMTPEERKAMANDFLFKATADMRSAEDEDAGYEKGYKYLNDYVQRLAEVSEYERKAYYSKTFWGDTKEWVQRIGKVVLGASFLGAALSGAPAYAAIFLGWGMFQMLSVNYMQYQEKLMSGRRGMALELQGKLGSQMSMYEKIMKGETLSRMEEWYFNITQSDNESKIEDLAKDTNGLRGGYPGDDWAHKLFSTVFGGEGVIAGSLSGGR